MFAKSWLSVALHVNVMFSVKSIELLLLSGKRGVETGGVVSASSPYLIIGNSEPSTTVLKAEVATELSLQNQLIELEIAGSITTTAQGYIKLKG